MLLRRDEHGTLAIGQASHAWLSGQLAAAWGGGRFGPPPAEEVRLAAEQHDVGMAEWDLDPDLDPGTGLPVDFMHMDLATHLRLWRAAPAKLLTQSAYAALLVSMHGTALYAMRDLEGMDAADAEAVRAYLAQESSWQHELGTRLGVEQEALARDGRLVWTWDGLSLALCLGWEPYVARKVPTADGHADVALRALGDGAFTLDPWPLACDVVTVGCEGRRLREGATALSDAPIEALRFELRAG